MGSGGVAGLERLLDLSDASPVSRLGWVAKRGAFDSRASKRWSLALDEETWVRCCIDKGVFVLPSPCSQQYAVVPFFRCRAQAMLGVT